MRLFFVLIICFTLVSISACPENQNNTSINIDAFGFGQLKVENESAYGKRPLLVILVNHKDSKFSWHYTKPDGSIDDEYYRNLFWGNERYTAQNINDYYIANSYGQFSWEKVDNGIHGPYDVGDDVVIDPDNINMLGIISNNIIEQMDRDGFDFARFDKNNDGVVNNAELTLFIIDNAGDFGGAKRYAPNCVTAQNSNNISICVDPAAASHGANFASIAHELAHQLKTIDIYGSSCNSFYFTLMSCTAALSYGETQIFHLDPWHKMVLGWITPRLYEFTLPENIDELHSVARLGEGSCAVIESAQYQGSEAAFNQSPLLFYFKGLNAQAFFMLEYRNRDAYVDGMYNYDRSLPSNGLAIWQIMTTADNNVALETVPGLIKGTDMANFLYGAPNGARSFPRLWNTEDGVFALKWLDHTDIGLRLKVSPIDIHNPRQIEVEWGMGRLPFAKLDQVRNISVHTGGQVLLSGKFGIEKRDDRRVVIANAANINQDHLTEVEVLKWNCNAIKIKIPRDLVPGGYNIMIIDEANNIAESMLGITVL